MADTSLIEVVRATHEEIERYEQAIVDILLSAPSSSAGPVSLLAHKLALQRDHKVSDLLDRIVQRKAQLREFYSDPQGDRASELSLLKGSDDDGEFPKRLAKVHEFHAKYPQAAPEAFAVDFSSLESGTAGAIDFVDRMFSGEEMVGKYLDLVLQHELFSNLKGVRKVPYVSYLTQFDLLTGEQATVPNQTKKAEVYRQYLTSLKDYLASYLRKTRPLSDVDRIEREVDTTFSQLWDEGKVEGWTKFGPVSEQSDAPSVGGIWCPACKKMYSKQTVYDAHLKSPKHLKAAARLAGGQESASHGLTAGDKWRHVALVEQYIMAYARVLDGVRHETRSNIERRAALTEREREAEAEAAEAALRATGDEAMEEVREEEEDRDGDDKLYNPLRLPLGWDGKPIPFWLYKLHGLGKEFKCQICSDYVYQGRRAFERHFQESRHAFGMRALGLPNTKHFFEITKIADALACKLFVQTCVYVPRADN